MYNPAAFAFDDRQEIVALLRRAALGHLVTHGRTDTGDLSSTALSSTALSSTALPFVIDDDLTHVRAHFARANPQWRSIDGAEALLIVPGLDTYISPRWYPSKAENGKVVPTWNYELVHLHGTVEIHDDPQWVRTMVQDLTNQHEGRLSESDQRPPWQVGDAPDEFIAGQLKAIVGVRLNVTKVDAKRKLSQNRTEGDRLGAIAGLTDSASPSDREIAALMDRPS
ncbi:MAG: FMN-binding negative transcriptional regulator [Acidimicrobiales bacterium]